MKKITEKETTVNNCSALETRDHLKNGASPKSQTSRGNFLRIAYFSLLAVSIIFSACKKDNDDDNNGIMKLEISVENGKEYSSRIDKVKLFVYGDNNAVVTVDYNDGNFTLQLPTTVTAGCLYGIGGYGFPSTVSINNPNAQAAEVAIVGYKGDKQVCSFYYRKVDEGNDIYTSGYPLYVNSTLTINGTETRVDDRDITRIYEENYIYSINAKKGWNMWYHKRTNTYTETATGTKEIYNRVTTTTDPGGLKWVVEFRNYYWDGVTAGSNLNINAQVENGNNYNNIRRVRADGYRYALAVGNYSNGGFSLTIPNKTYPELTIENFFNWYYGDTDGLFISNKYASMESFSRIEGYSSNSGYWDWNDYVGRFIYGKIESNSVTRTMWMFVDMDVHIIGSISSSYYGTYNCNMNLKAGWNTVYLTETSSEDRIMSTISVNGLKWYFEYDFHKSSPFPIKRLINSSNVKSRIFQRELYLH